MSWSPMRGNRSITPGNNLPGKRGRYLLKLGAPLVEDGPRWIHFSWLGEAFCLRDYTSEAELRQKPGLTASDVWQQAIDRLPATGKYFLPADDVETWKQLIQELDGTR
jgi:hypothetical protein